MESIQETLWPTTEEHKTFNLDEILKGSSSLLQWSQHDLLMMKKKLLKLGIQSRHDLMMINKKIVEWNFLHPDDVQKFLFQKTIDTLFQQSL
jgi:hypothetical protein